MLYDNLHMQRPSTSIICDGCGRPASPGHIAERVARLELATRFRPVHINVLLVALAPLPRPEDDFYGTPQSREYFESLMEALEISPPTREAAGEWNQGGEDAARLTEFQRRGYYLSYLSECPVPEQIAGGDAAIFTALGPEFVRRVRFNYKPKHVALVGNSLGPMIEILEKSGLGALLLLDRGQPFAVPKTSDLPARSGFLTGLRTAVSTGATS
jgi:hypothetical protein